MKDMKRRKVMNDRKQGWEIKKLEEVIRLFKVLWLKTNFSSNNFLLNLHKRKKANVETLTDDYLV